MKRFLVTCAAVLLVSASLRADVTVKQTMSMSGGMTAMAGSVPMPVMTMRIKGGKARTDVDVMGQTVSTIADLAAKQVYILNAADKTAKLVDLSAAPPAGAAGAAAVAAAPKIDVKFAPTGKSQPITGVNCDEYSFAMTIGMGETLPPEQAAMMKDVKMVMNGSIWMTKTGPGVAEYIAFQKAAADAGMASAISGSMPGMNSGGLDKVMAAAATAQGLPYLTEVIMTVEGTGQMVEMFSKMGPMKITNQVTDVSTAPIADDLFKVPADYKVVKQ